MQRKTTITALMVVLCLAGMIAGCSPTLATRGNFVEDERLKNLQVQVSTKDEVRQRLGTPTTIDPFDDNRWFYIGEKTETTAFYQPDVVERKVLLVVFNEDGFMQSADLVDEKAAQNVEIVKKKTPAPGREMNAFEQFVNNIGKFNQGAAPTPMPGR